MASANIFHTCHVVKTQASPSANREIRQEIVSQLFGSRPPTLRAINNPMISLITLIEEKMQICCLLFSARGEQTEPTWRRLLGIRDKGHPKSETTKVSF